MVFNCGLKNTEPLVMSQSHRPSMASFSANHSWFSRFFMSASRAMRREMSRATDRK
jgi:hypothetical protein